MPSILTFQGSQIAFPTVCLVCQRPAEKEYEVTHTLQYGDCTRTLTLAMPLCSEHFAVASKKSRTEELMGQIGLVLGALAGIGSAGGLLWSWSQSQDSHWLMNLAIAAFLGGGCFLAVWLCMLFYVAPLFADADSKTVRQTMKIRHYWPDSENVQLQFATQNAADLMASLNADRLLQRE